MVVFVEHGTRGWDTGSQPPEMLKGAILRPCRGSNRSSNRCSWRKILPIATAHRHLAKSPKRSRVLDTCIRTTHSRAFAGVSGHVQAGYANAYGILPGQKKYETTRDTIFSAAPAPQRVTIRCLKPLSHAPGGLCHAVTGCCEYSLTAGDRSVNFLSYRRLRITMLVSVPAQ